MAGGRLSQVQALGRHHRGGVDGGSSVHLRIPDGTTASCGRGWRSLEFITNLILLCLPDAKAYAPQQLPGGGVRADVITVVES
jgi:hypothetical protein